MIPNFRVLSQHIKPEYVLDAVKNGWGSDRNRYIDKCERFLETYTSRRHAVMFNNATNAATAGLTYTRQCVEEFITQNNTWIGTISPAARSNLGLHLINTRSPYFISESDLEEFIIPYFAKLRRPAVICNTDIMGFCANHEILSAICNEHGHIYVVDSAESLGTTINGKQSASYGLFSTISFNSTKIVTGTGGGALLTDDDDLAHYARGYRNNFRDYSLSGKHFWSSDLSTNANASNVLAAMVYGQLESIGEILQSRRALNRKYRDHMGDCIDNTPYPSEPNYWHTCYRYNHNNISCEEIIDRAAILGLELRPGFYRLTEQPVAQVLQGLKEINSTTNQMSKYVCLPGGAITDDEVEATVNIMRKIANEK